MKKPFLLLKDQKAFYLRRLLPDYSWYSFRSWILKHKIFFRDTLQIVELPIGTWTDDYKKFLETLIDQPNSNVKDFVAGYKIHYEKISDIKYQAEFSIYFNINKIKNWLSSHDVSFYENLNSKIIYLNANFDSFKNWRLLIDNIESVKEISDLQILSLTYKSSLIYVTIDVINETSLFNIFNKSRIDIQKRINTNNEYNISLIDYNKTIIDSFEANDKNIKKDSSILLTEWFSFLWSFKVEK